MMGRNKNKEEHREDPREPGGDAREPGPHAPESAADPAEHIETLRAERDDFESKWLRALADFQNYQRRAAQSEQEARRQGATSVLQAIIPVLDHFDLALAQLPAVEGSGRIVEGVRVIRDELVRAIQSGGVALIEPKPGDEFQPMRHEAVMQEAADGVEGGAVARTLQAGYSLGDRVIRPAKVAVAPPES